MTPLPEVKVALSDCRVIAQDVNPRDYHAVNGYSKRGEPGFCMSRSELMDFANCPAEWLAGIPESQSNSLEFGALMDCLVTAPHTFEARYAIAPETCIATKTMNCVRDGRAKEGERVPWNPLSGEAKAWKASVEKAGMIPLSAEEMDRADCALKRLKDDARIRDLLDCSRKQVMVLGTYRDKATGIEVPLKALLDLVPDAEHALFGKCLADFKTARDVTVRAYRRQVFQDGLHIQAALYLDLYVAATGEDRVEWLHPMLRNVEPFQPARRALFCEWLDIGRLWYRSALEFYCQCLHRKEWPGYDDLFAPHEYKPTHGFRYVDPEPWMISADLPPNFPPDPRAEEEPREELIDLMP